MLEETDPLDLNCNANKASKSLGLAEDREGNSDKTTELEFECLSTQIGGHTSRLEKYKKTKLGIFDLKNGLILKTLLPPPRGPRELKFYQDVFSPDCRNLDLIALRPFIPTFHGMEEKTDTTMIKLTNLTATFKKPCVMDLKMGRVTYDQEATAEKRHYEAIKFPPLMKTGFQIVGMIIQNDTEKKVVDKHYTRSLSEKTLVTDGLVTFFSILSEEAKKQTLHGLVARLKKIEDWFLKQKRLSFTASSLLFIYEGKNGNPMMNSDVNKKADLMHGDKLENFRSLDSTVFVPELGDSVPASLDAIRKRSHDNTNNDNGEHDNCDDSNECVPINKIAKGTETARTNPNEDSLSGKRIESSTSKSHFVATPSRHSCTTDPSESIPEFSVHLIDFAHVFPASDTDENFLFGLQNLISSLQMLAE